MMKKRVRSGLLRYGIALFACANTLLVDAQLELTLKPEKSMGFAAWSGSADSTALLMYEKVGTSYNLLSREVTYQNYIWIDPVYFRTPNRYYRIVSMKDSSTTETGYVPALPVGGNGYNELGTKVCNGRSYAYELVAFNNSPNPTVRLTTRHASNYYNDSTLVWVPYYQAIAQASWDLLPVDHPYRFLNLYHKVKLESHLTTGTFMDKNLNFVTDGFLVQKQPDQFLPYVSSGTEISAGFPINLSPPLTGAGSWVDFYNDHIDETTYNTALNYFSPYIIPALACVDSYVVPAPPITWQNWHDWYKQYHDMIKELQNQIQLGGGTLASADLEEMIHTVQIDDTDELYTTGVAFKRFNSESYIHLVKSGNSLDVHSASNTIPAGLYQVSVFSNSESVLPLYIDIQYNIPISPLKDYATVMIAPNPIVSNDLTLNIDNKKGGAITVELFDINGNLLLTDGFTMAKEKMDKHYDIAIYRLPSDLIVVKVSFADGSFTSVTGTR